IVLYLSLFLVVIFRFYNNMTHAVIYDHLIAFTPLIIITIFVYFINNLYDYGFKLKGIDFITFLGRIQLFLLLIGIIYFYIMPIGITPKTNLLLFWIISSIFIYFNHALLQKKSMLEKINILLLSNTDLSLEIQNIVNNNSAYGLKIFIYPDTVNIDHIKDFVLQNKIQTIVIQSDKVSTQKLYPLLFENVNFQTFEAFYETIFQKISIDTIDHN
ncbi:MAG: hypothetical protein WC422_05495, partial [Candidatus Paceibacterota bacterium]